MAKKFSLDDLKSAFASGGKSGGNSSKGKYYNFFNMEFDDSCTIRFLPDANTDNPRGFLVEKHVHKLEINGKKETVPCLKMYGEDCPICDVAQSFYNEDDEVNGGKFYRKVSHLAQVLVKEDPISYDNPDDTCEGKVKAVVIGPQIHAIMVSGFADLDEIPFDYEEGSDFIITKGKKGKWSDYALGTKFARKETALTDDELELVEKELIDLSTLLPEKPSLESVQAKLKAAMTGTAYEEEEDADEEGEEIRPRRKPTTTRKKVVEEVENEEDDEEDDEEEVVSKPSSRRKKVVEEPEDDEDEDEDEDDGNAVIARIKARRAAAKNK